MFRLSLSAGESLGGKEGEAHSGTKILHIRRAEIHFAHLLPMDTPKSEHYQWIAFIFVS